MEDESIITETKLTGTGNSENIHSEANVPRARWFKTICLTGTLILLGLINAISGPTMLDLTELLNCTYEEISRAVMIRAIGIFIGSFLGAFVSDRGRRYANLIISFSALICGISTAAVPWSPNLVVCGLLHGIQGVCQGVLNVAGNSLVLAEWGDQAGTPAHILQMGFSIGGTVAPPMTTAFLSPDKDDNNTSWGDSRSDIYMFHNQTNGTTSESQIYIPYAIIGGYSVFLTILFLAIHFSGLSFQSGYIAERKSLREMMSLGACAGGRKCYALYVLISLFFLYVCIVTINNSMYSHITAIAVKSRVHIPKKQATILTTAYRACATLGRFLGAAFSHCCKIQIILFVEVIGNVVANTCTLLFGFNSPLHLWILSCVVGTFAAPNYPSTMCWADRYIEVTGCVVTVIDVGVAIGTFISIWISGYVLQTFGPQYVFWVTLTAAISILAITVPLQIVSCTQGPRSYVLQITEEAGEVENPDERTPLIN